MKRCPACGTSFIYGGEFCSMDGTKLISVPTPSLADSTALEGSEPPNATLVSGSLQPEVPRPTIPVDEAPTGSLNAGGNVTIALGLGDSALIGAVLADRYKLEALIGRGGMGVVYRARHLLLDRAVAVKLLRPQYLEDERAVQRFMREAQAMARVEHVNAVATHDFGMMPDGGAYLVMEYIEGETLRSVLSRVGTLGAAEAVAVAEQICGAVDAAHRQGVVHRDLKPENIMFKRTDDGPIVKVVDFGLAKVTDSAAEGKPQLTSAGDLFGTPAYMAPEYFEGEEVGPRTDVYSIGVIVYEMLAGVPPFQGSVQTIMSGHLFKEPPTLSDSRPLTPPGVERAVHTALRKRAAERYGTAADFAARLVAGLSGDDMDVESVPTGAITTRINRELIPPRPSRELPSVAAAPAPDESPTYMGFSSDDVETIGAPGRISTADIVEPAAAVVSSEPEIEIAAEAEPVELATESIRIPVPVRSRRRSIPMAAAASVIGAALVGGLVFAMTTRTGSPSVDGAIPQATPDMRALPSMLPDPPADEPDAPSADAPPDPIADAGGSAPAPTPGTVTRPTVSKMEVAPSRPDRATDGSGGEPAANDAVTPANDAKSSTDRHDAQPDEKKATTNDGKAEKDDKDKGKKKRKWFNPFSW